MTTREEELNNILNSEDDTPIEIMPDGSIKECAKKTDVNNVITPDQEVWIKCRIATAINIAYAAYKNSHCRADDGIAEGAINGVINGAAIEIIRTLGRTPVFVNLRKD